MEKDYLKKEIMDQSRHLFIYGEDGEPRREFLKSLKEDYKPGTKITTPVAVYLEEYGLPKLANEKGKDRGKIDAIAREHLSFSMAHAILKDAIGTIDTKELNSRLKKMLQRINQYSKNKDFKEIENVEELLEIMKASRDFYKNYYLDYVTSGKEGDIYSIAIPFLQLEMWIEDYKRHLEMSSYFGMIVDKQEPIAIASTKNINFYVGGRINSELSMKIATSPEGWDTYYDPNGQMVEAIHDYGTVELDDSMKKYMKTLKAKVEEE